MVTTYTEGVQFMKILLDWCSPQVARSMLDDMDFYIADSTENESIRDSIKMVRKILYQMAEENQIVDEEENLRDYIAEICSIIYMESPLEYQDVWLERMISLGYYKREFEPKTEDV